MIYEYPEDFIVPIAFAEDLIQKRNETISERDILIIEKNLESNKMDLEKMKGQVNNKHENHGYKYDMIQEIEDNSDTKTILNNIDEEYAISETLDV